jgi:hypothetical protein
MDPEKLATLARGDFEQQEKYSEALSKSVQFSLTLATLIGTASVAMFKTRLIEAAGRAEVRLDWGFAVAMWLLLIFAVVAVARALWAQKAAVPRAMDEYLKWIRERQAQLCAAGYTDDQAAEAARAAVVAHITAAYADSAGVNRAVNLKRQRSVARATVLLILAGCLLAGQAACNCIFVYREATYGGAATAERRTGTASADERAGTPATATSD